jgi:hypothetical protein
MNPEEEVVTNRRYKGSGKFRLGYDTSPELAAGEGEHEVLRACGGRLKYHLNL